ncbi:hypothetical protein D9M69_511070 [compost metagenome]
MAGSATFSAVTSSATMKEANATASNIGQGTDGEESHGVLDISVNLPLRLFNEKDLMLSGVHNRGKINYSASRHKEIY